jgi:transposase
MEKRDARLLSQDAQQEVRMQAIRLLRTGKTQREVAELVQVQRTTVNAWWKLFLTGGHQALKKGKRGRPAGQSKFLNPEQIAEMKRLLVDKTPDQMKLKFALWSREAVRQVIKERYGVDYAPQTISVLLKEWGFTPQRPIKRAYEQRPAEVKKWLDETYPKIAKRAKTEGAEVYWGDETAVKPEPHVRRGFAPKGKTPVVRQPAKRFHSSLISAINNQGKIQWMALSKALDAELFIDFLKRLIKHRKRKIFLIVDNLRVHHSKLVKEWLEEHKARIELFYLPSYSPELNPDEYLNNTLKQTISRHQASRDKPTLDAEVDWAMLMFEFEPEMVRRCFQHPNVRYAA